MGVLVDTSVWSHALRKKKRSSTKVVLLEQLIGDGLVKIIGPIRQELLSGISDWQQFTRLRKNLSYFSDLKIKSTDFELAAEFYNACRQKGIQGSHTDFLICAVAINYDLQIFTTDNDFENYQRIIPIKLFS